MRDLEELLDETILCVERYRAGRLATTEAALEGGRLLESARSRLNHGDWLPWLDRVGLNRATANRWMRLTRLGMTAAEILEAGGMRAVLEAQTTTPRPRGRARREDLVAEVEEASEVVKEAKPAYYNAMTRRGQLVRELDKLGPETQEPEPPGNVSP